MDLTQLANLGEFVGGIGVMVTLIYLAVQVRSAARQERISSMQEATREMAAVTQSVGDTTDKAEIWLRGCTDFEGLSLAERLRFSVTNGHIFRLFEQIYYQEQEGSVEGEVLQGFRNWLRDIAAYPGVQGWWATRRHWYGERFRSFVESQMSGENQPSMFGEAGGSQST